MERRQENREDREDSYKRQKKRREKILKVGQKTPPNTILDGFLARKMFIYEETRR